MKELAYADRILILTLIAFSGLLMWVWSLSPERRGALDLPTASALAAGGVEFYGARYEGDLFVWCLDRSASMSWAGEWEGLKGETASALESLSLNQSFSLVTYSTNTSVWSSFPQLATWQNKLIATEWLERFSPAGWSCMRDALVKAINILAPSASGLRKVVLVAGNGPPICNGVDTRSQTLGTATAANWFGAEIHTVLIGDDDETAAFYAELALLNSGSFRQVPASSPPPPPRSVGRFLRGDVNGNGDFNALVDGLSLLHYQFFHAGFTPPPCFDAADADDDGLVNGLVDAVFILGFGFLQNHPPPPPPGPFACDVDPTDDPIECEEDFCP